MYSRCRQILLCAVLELSALMGVPIVPKDIHDLMNKMNQTVAQELTSDDNDPAPGEQ